MVQSLRTFEDLQAAVGRDLGSSDWMVIDQARVDMFGRAVEDLQWIHVDPDRCHREAADGTTIAHGLLVLALVSHLRSQIPETRFELPMRMGLFYGINKVRFVSPVKVGAEIRLRLKIAEARLIEPKIIHIAYDNSVEIKGESRPALVAQTLSRAYLD